MKNFTVYTAEGKILRAGTCQSIDFDHQAQDDGFVMKGKANGTTQKIEFDGFNVDGQPINPRVVNKTAKEMKAEKEKEESAFPEGRMLAQITNEKWEAILKRLDILEAKEK